MSPLLSWVISTYISPSVFLGILQRVIQLNYEIQDDNSLNEATGPVNILFTGKIKTRIYFPVKIAKLMKNAIKTRVNEQPFQLQ